MHLYSLKLFANVLLETQDISESSFSDLENIDAKKG